MSADISTATNRTRLRLVLLSSAAILLLIALFTFALLGLQWAIAPAVLAALSGVVALGRMTRRSFSLFVADLRSTFIGTPAGAVTTDTPSPEPTSASKPATEPEYIEYNASPSLPASDSESESAATIAPFVPISVLGLSETYLGVVVIILGLLSAAFSLYMFPQGPPNTLAWWSYGLSVILALGAVPAFEGGWSVLFARFRRGYQVSFEPRALLPWLALGVILMLALIIRVYNLDGFPPGLWFDEADNLGRASQIAEDPSYLPVFVPFTELPSFFLLPIAVVIKFAGISITTGRLVAVVFGLAGIVAMFLMVRHMLGPMMGLVAAFLTAVMRWDIIWSRTGMHGITAPFFAALTAWLTYRAVSNGRRTDFALAGLALGLGMWYYAAYRLFPLVIAFVLIHGLITARERRKRFMLNVGIMAFFAAMVTLPLTQFIVSHPDEFFRRTEVTSVFAQTSEEETGRVIRESLVRHLGMFHLEGDPNGRHNIPRAPMLDIFSGLLMLLGLAVAVTKWRIAAFIVLPLWIIVMIMPGVLTIPWEAPQSLRTITVIPAVIALTTIGVGFIWKVGSSVRAPAVRVGTAAFIAVLLAVIAYTNLSAYFVEQANSPEVYASYSTDETLMARDLADQAERGYVPMVSRQFRHSLVASLFGHRFPRQTIAAPTTIPLDPALVWRGAAIYLEPRESGFFDTLKAYYPSADFREIRPPVGGDVLYYSAYISRKELEGAQGLVERRTASDGGVVEMIRKSTQGVWALEADSGDVPFDVEWMGVLHITHPGEYFFVLDSDTPTTMFLDGVAILTDSDPEVSIEPAVGLHSLEVRGHVKDADGVLRLLWRPPPSPPKEGEQPPLDDDAGERALEPIPASNLYHGDIRPVGLSGRFFKAAEDRSQIAGRMPDAMQVTSGVGGAFWYHPVIEHPHFAVWDGTLNVPESGLYKFRFGNIHGELKVVVDGDTVIDTRADRESEVELVAGRHRVSLEYQSSVGSPWFEVLWTPPGQPEARIGPENLSPAPEYMFRMVE